MAKSNTPRTDAMLEVGVGVPESFAKGLELELKAALVELIGLRKAKRVATQKERALLGRMSKLEKLLGNMTPGPYGCWDNTGQGKVFLMAEVKENKRGRLIGEKETVEDVNPDFRAIAELLNAAPVLILLARERLEHG